MALRGGRPGPLLVVHGLGDRAAAWRRFAAAMPAGRDIVTFDLPGHGESPPANDSRYPALVEAVGRAAAGYDRFALLGHSVGGALAWLYAASHPERVTRLVLVEPAPHRSRFLAGPTPPASSLRLRRRREGDWPALLGGVGRIRAPTLVVRAGGGMIGAGQLEEVAAAIPGARLLTLDGWGTSSTGSVPTSWRGRSASS